MSMTLQQCLDELGRRVADIRAERAALDDREKSLLVAIDLIQEEVERCAAPVIREADVVPPRESAMKTGRRRIDKTKTDAAIELVKGGKAIGEAAKTVGVHRNTLTARLKETHRGVEPDQIAPPSEPQPIRAKALAVDKGHIVTADEAREARENKEREGREASKNLKEFKAAARSNERLAACGKCVTRIINETPFFAAQPDCPEHGTGLGVAQSGRERKPDDLSRAG